MTAMFRRGFTAALLLSALAACSGHPALPTGRWQGVYEDGNLIVAARLEIDKNGHVRVSAPNAIGDFAGMSDNDRARFRAGLVSRLANSWAVVGNVPLDFDGKAFRKPGGVAPQLEWDANAHRMTMIYYSGNRASVRVPLQAVEDFDS
ncbi:MAG TPA: hypothetical protein VEU06_02825 [Micropepsaceae bacterium]|nr:hypothetical protein [Micropepsaceae bacterium]